MKLKVTKPFGINFSIDFSCRRGGGGEGGGRRGSSGFQVTGIFVISVYAFWKVLRLGNAACDFLGVNF